MKTRKRWHLLAPMLLSAASGCSGSDLVNASGKVTYKGRPVPSTLVIFHPDEAGKRDSHGLTDDSGNFRLSYSSTQQGVLRGRHTVVLRYRVTTDEELHKTPPKASEALRAVIAKYGDVKKSLLRYEVTSSGQFFDIQLE
jgi:hypothetical protein